MARLFSDQLSSPVGTAAAEARLWSSVTARSVLAGGILFGGALGTLLTLALAVPVAMEPGLIRLLHGMVAIKGLIFSAGTALLWLRLGGPAVPRALLGYTAGLGLSAGALAWLWGLNLLFPGAVLFYGGLLIAFLTASRDPLLVDALRQTLNRRVRR